MPPALQCARAAGPRASDVEAASPRARRFFLCDIKNRTLWSHCLVFFSFGKTILSVAFWSRRKPITWLLGLRSDPIPPVPCWGELGLTVRYSAVGVGVTETDFVQLLQHDEGLHPRTPGA